LFVFSQAEFIIQTPHTYPQHYVEERRREGSFPVSLSSLYINVYNPLDLTHWYKSRQCAPPRLLELLYTCPRTPEISDSMT